MNIRLGSAAKAASTCAAFRCRAPRSPQDFGAWSKRVFDATHSLNDELAWLDAEGPTSPALVAYLADGQARYDYVLFFSLRYYHAYHGARAVADKAILVPTAERDEVLGLEIFKPILRGVRACMYNSPEERALLQAMAGRDDVPGVVVGVGSEIPAEASAERFRQRTGLHGRTAIYIGRIDENKGCAELFDFWLRYSEITPGGMTLVLIGTPVLPVPAHPRIRHLGFVSDEEKYDALQAAEFLIMPSYFESLSMVTLEAWAHGQAGAGQRPVRRPARPGHAQQRRALLRELRRVRRGGAGARRIGRAWRPRSAGTAARYFQANYAWPIIEKKYLDMFARLSREPAADRAGRAMEPIPGWWRRRQRSLAPAREVLTSLPSGPVRAELPPADRPAERHERPHTPAQLDPGRGGTAPRETRADNRDRGGPRARHDVKSRPDHRGRQERERRDRRCRRRRVQAGRTPAGRAADECPAGRRASRGPDARCRRRCTRCSRRSATATRSATRCWGSSACSGPPATPRRSSWRRRITGSSI